MTISPILITIIFTISGLLHGLTGMGFPMIPTSIIANIASFEEAIILAILPSLFINIIMLTNQNDRPFFQEITYYLRTYWLLVISVLIGGYLGVKLLLFLDILYLYFLLSSIILFYVVTNLLGVRWRISTNPFTLIFFGFFAGIVGNATDAMAPLLMIYLLSTDKQTKEVIKAGNLAYLTGKIVQFWMLKSALFSLPTSHLLTLLAITLLTILALFIGIYFRKQISERFFKRLIFAILLILGIRAGINGMMLLLG